MCSDIFVYTEPTRLGLPGYLISRNRAFKPINDPSGNKPSSWVIAPTEYSQSRF